MITMRSRRSPGLDDLIGFSDQFRLPARSPQLRPITRLAPMRSERLATPSKRSSASRPFAAPQNVDMPSSIAGKKSRPSLYHRREPLTHGWAKKAFHPHHSPGREQSHHNSDLGHY